MHNIESDSDEELPQGWEERATEDGNVYYINSFTNKIQWVHPQTGRKKVLPKDLPFGWTKSVNEDGETIFIQKETNTTTYLDPRLAFAVDEKEHVHDFRQRFDGSSTAYQILHGIDLSMKYVLITGCNAGIGYETAKSMARHGCNILFANRNMEATNKAIKQIVQETNACEDNLKAIHCDLASLESVKKCALAVPTVFAKYSTMSCVIHGCRIICNPTSSVKFHKSLDMVILNAGLFGLPYTETTNQLETIYQVNHLSQMYLALLLEPLLKKGSRVVFVSSESHRFTSLQNRFSMQNLAMTKEEYSSMMSYNNSKLYNVITAKVLSEEWKSKGIYVNSLHPGNMVFTNLSKSWWLYRLAFLLVRPFTKSLQQAAATTIYVATAAELEGVTGLYFNNCFYCEESALARDKEIAYEVFSMSLKNIVEKVGSEHIQKYCDKYIEKKTTS